MPDSVKKKKSKLPDKENIVKEKIKLIKSGDIIRKDDQFMYEL